MNSFKKTTRLTPLTLLQYAFFILILLYWGRALFVPLCVALLISFILYPLCRWLENHKIRRIPAIFMGLTIFLVIIGGVIGLLAWQMVGFLKEWPLISTKLHHLINQIDQNLSGTWVNVFLEPDETLMGKVVDYIGSDILPLLPGAIYQSSVSMFLLVLLPIYVALILYYREVLVAFLIQMLPEDKKGYVKDLLPDVIITYYNFIKGMGLVYLIVGILNCLGLFLLGIPNPIFFGFIASILTFIPYVGIAVGAILPMSISWIVYDSVMYPLGIIVVFAVVQVLEANIIFPWAVSRRLKMNALVTLILIIGGGIIWGVMGMILFLPFAAILKLIANQVKELQPIAILLGTKEDLNRN